MIGLERVPALIQELHELTGRPKEDIAREFVDVFLEEAQKEVNREILEQIKKPQS